MERVAQEMKKFFMDNVGLKIIALFFALFLWVIVVNIDNPIKRGTFADVPVTIINDDIITQEGNVYQVVGEQKVNVVISAKRKTLQSISKSSIIATADIKAMDLDTGLVPIKISLNGYTNDSYESAEAVPRNLQIKTEKTGKKVLSLTVSSSGEPRDGYVFGDMTVHPEKITITGSESKIAQVESAVAKINVAGLSRDAEVTAELFLYDSDGNSVDQSQLSNNLGEEGITVSVQVFEKKTVSVSCKISGEPAEGYKVSRYVSEPEGVQICGPSSVISKVTQIAIPDTELNIEGESEKIEKTIDITPYLPEGTKLVDENGGNVLVTVVIEPEGTRTIEFLVSSIKINNLDEKLKVTYEPDAEIILRFKGEDQLLDVLDVRNSVSVDMKNCTRPGTYSIPVSVDVPEGIQLMEDVSVQLVLEEKKEETPATEGNDASQSGRRDSGE